MPETRQTIIDNTVDEILECNKLCMLDEANLKIVLYYMASRLESIHNDAALARLDKIFNKENEQ